jgi:hypothetical protein
MNSTAENAKNAETHSQRASILECGGPLPLFTAAAVQNSFAWFQVFQSLPPSVRAGDQAQKGDAHGAVGSASTLFAFFAINQTSNQNEN